MADRAALAGDAPSSRSAMTNGGVTESPFAVVRAIRLEPNQVAPLNTDLELGSAAFAAGAAG